MKLKKIKLKDILDKTEMKHLYGSNYQSGGKWVWDENKQEWLWIEDRRI